MGVAWVDYTTAHCAAGRGDFINRGKWVVESEIHFEMAVGTATAAFDSDTPVSGRSMSK